MPKYVALVVLTTQDGNIQIGEEFEMNDPKKEKILTERGFIKAAIKKPEEIIPPNINVPEEVEQPKKSTK